MSVIAEFEVGTGGQALTATLRAVPEVHLELVQEVGTDPREPFLFVWMTGADPERFETAMAGDDSVTAVERYVEAGDRTLYRMRITDAVDAVSYPMWVELGAEQLEATWFDGYWHNRMRFPDREALATCRDWCLGHDIEFDLTRVYSEEAGPGGGAPLTPEQREVFRVAYEMGYFEVPRQSSMADLATALGISSQAVSERLRRGYRALVRAHVLGSQSRASNNWA